MEWKQRSQELIETIPCYSHFRLVFFSSPKKCSAHPQCFSLTSAGLFSFKLLRHRYAALSKISHLPEYLTFLPLSVFLPKTSFLPSIFETSYILLSNSQKPPACLLSFPFLLSASLSFLCKLLMAPLLTLQQVLILNHHHGKVAICLMQLAPGSRPPLPCLALPGPKRVVKKENKPLVR